jgi:hypothetical protein
MLLFGNSEAEIKEFSQIISEKMCSGFPTSYYGFISIVGKWIRAAHDFWHYFRSKGAGRVNERCSPHFSERLASIVSTER